MRHLSPWLVLLCVWLPLSAFGGKMVLHPPAARADALAEVMQARLSLTPEQTTAVREIAEKHAEATDAARAQYTRKQFRKQVKAIGAARDADLRSILTAEQFATYKNDKRAIMKSMQSRMKGTEPDGQAPPAVSPGPDGTEAGGR